MKLAVEICSNMEVVLKTAYGQRVIRFLLEHSTKDIKTNIITSIINFIALKNEEVIPDFIKEGLFTND